MRVSMKWPILAVLLLLPVQSWAAVSYVTVDNTAAFGATTATTVGVVPGAGSDRAAIITIILSNNAVTNMVCTTGGVSSTLIAGTDSGATYTVRTMALSVINPPTGGQSTVCNWTGNSDIFLATVYVTGADQTTPANGGTFNGVTASTTCSLSITSTNGDLTTSAVRGNTSTTTNQTQKWQTYVTVRGDIGPGTGTTTHTWTDSSGAITCVGANFVQVGGGGGAAVLQSPSGYLGEIIK